MPIQGDLASDGPEPFGCRPYAGDSRKHRNGAHGDKRGASCNQGALDHLARKPLTVEMIGADDKAECTICIDELYEGDEVVELPCKHWFHDACVVMWLKRQKLSTIIGDNASSNDKLCRLLSSGLQEKGIQWDISINRIRCNEHIINLAVQAFLFYEAKEESQASNNLGSLSSLRKLHNIIAHTRGSPSRIIQFKDLAGRLIPLNNSTRWNSWYEMIRITLEKESAIDTYSKAWFDNLKQDFLSPEDWDILRLIQSFLLPFYRATKATEGDQATIDSILLTMDILVQHFKESLTTFKLHPLLSQQVEKSWAIFDKYYLKTDDSPFYIAAILLHPTQKLDYLKYN